MDPLLPTLNFQVKNYIHDDIVFSILSKLSLKSFKRFECVCKPWSLLFHNPYFMTMFRNYMLSKDYSYYDDMSLLLHLKYEDTLYSLSGERFEKIVKLKFPFIRRRIINFSFEILHRISCNGTLCLEYQDLNGDLKLILWNPTTTEVKLIPGESNCFSNVLAHHYQVGYDHVKDDYKMIRCTHFAKSHHSFWEIFSLKSNSWRKLKDHMSHSDRCSEEVYLDGVSYWWDQSGLVSFDFIKESFITTPIPYNELEVLYFNHPLAVLNGYIACIVNYTETSTFHISILGENGVKESWTKLFIVGPLPCLKCPIGIGKKGNILITKKDDGLAWFDLSTGMIDEIGVTAESHCKLLFHKESLLPIGGIYNQFSSCFRP